MARFDCVGLGMNVLDILIRMDEMPTWEHSVNPSRVLVDGGGLAATAIITAQQFGLRTAFIGTYGNDPMGEIKHNLMTKHGVDLSHDVQMDAPENQICVVLVDENNGERHFQPLQFFWSHFLTHAELDYDFLRSADMLHIDGYHPEAALAASQTMRAEGRLVMFDAGRTSEKQLSSENDALSRNCDYLISGSGFLQALTGMDDLQEAGRKALDYGPRVVVQTEGELGCYTFTRDECFHTPAFAVQAVDTTGAGDVFHGAYLYGIHHGWELHTITRFATAAAALECTQLGGRVSIPPLSAVVQFLAAHSE